MPEILTAPAHKKPCELHRYHWPKVVRTQGHHIHPVYLQNRLWGNIRDNELMYVCGTCHDSLHATIDWLLGDSNYDPPVGTKVRKAAQATVDWYRLNGG